MSHDLLTIYASQTGEIIEEITPNADTDLQTREQLLQQTIEKIWRKPLVARYRQKGFQSSRLVAFDLDGTLTEEEFMLKAGHHIPEQETLYRLTREAIEGVADWESNYRARVQLFKGYPVRELRRQTERVRITPGARDLIDRLTEELGASVALITGAWQTYAETIAHQLHIPLVFGTEWEEQNGSFTGEIKGQVRTPQIKAQVVAEVALHLGLTLGEVTAVGDGYNDLPMLASAGQAILYHAPTIEQCSIDQLIDFII